jgi:hypothetical protein
MAALLLGPVGGGVVVHLGVDRRAGGQQFVDDVGDVGRFDEVGQQRRLSLQQLARPRHVSVIDGESQIRRWHRTSQALRRIGRFAASSGS